MKSKTFSERQGTSIEGVLPCYISPSEAKQARTDRTKAMLILMLSATYIAVRGLAQSWAQFVHLLLAGLVQAEVEAVVIADGLLIGANLC